MSPKYQHPPPTRLESRDGGFPTWDESFLSRACFSFPRREKKRQRVTVGVWFEMTVVAALLLFDLEREEEKKGGRRGEIF
jgi:hypothetical protein